jgi:hypothetical protein
VKTDSPPAGWQQPLTLAMARAATEAPDAPIGKVQVQFKGRNRRSRCSSANPAAA